MPSEKMCRNLQTHVQIIAVICIGHWVCSTLFVFISYGIHYRKASDVALSGVQIGFLVQDGISLVIYVLCLIGAKKRNKYLLIPFIILVSFYLSLLTGIIVLGIVLATVFKLHRYIPRADHWRFLIALLPYLIIPLIKIGWLVYSLTIVARLYKEISSGITSGQQQDMELQHYDAQWQSTLAEQEGCVTIG